MIDPRIGAVAAVLASMGGPYSQLDGATLIITAADKADAKAGVVRVDLNDLMPEVRAVVLEAARMSDSVPPPDMPGR